MNDDNRQFLLLLVIFSLQQVSDWKPELMEMEDQAKGVSRDRFTVISHNNAYKPKVTSHKRPPRVCVPMDRGAVIRALRCAKPRVVGSKPVHIHVYGICFP